MLSSSSTFCTTAISVLFVSLLLCCISVAVPIHAQTKSVVDVDRTRLWLYDHEPTFRKSKADANPLPNYAQNVTFDNTGKLLAPALAKHSAVFVKNWDRILVFGGEQANAALNAAGHSSNRAGTLPTNRLLVFDIRSNMWYEEPPFSGTKALPKPRMHHAAWLMADGHTMIVHGGVGDDSQPRAFDTAFGDVWRYRNRTWTKVAHVGPKLYGHSAVVHKNKAYIFGGTSGRHFYNRLYEVDLGIPAGVTQTTSTHSLINISFKEVATTGDPPPRARAFHGAAVSESLQRGSEMLIFGGHDGLNPMDDLYSLNLDTKQWTFLGRSNSDPVRAFSDLDTKRVLGVTVPAVAHHSCSALFPIMLCVGGSKAQPQVLEFDLSLRRWLRSYTRNESLLPLTDTRTFVRRSDETGEQELWAVGGLSGAAPSFNESIVKTSMFTQPCPEKFVNPDFSAGRCVSCPAGSIVIASADPHACQICTQGTYEKAGTCHECPPGTYNPANSSTNVTACLDCPPGFFTIGGGAKSLAECIKCPIGTFAENAQCLPCPAGTFGFTDGGEGYDRGCKPCPYGSWSAAGQTSCERCPPGTSSGPYVERANPGQLHLWRMNTVVPPVSAFPGSCPGSSAAYPTTVEAGTWFYVLVTIGDSGGPMGDGSDQYHPLRDIFPAWPGGARPRFTVEFDGSPSVMYENCRSQDNLLTGCIPLGRNQTSVSRTQYTGSYADCSRWWRFMVGFSLRFDDPTTEDVTVTVRSGQLIPLQLKFKVVAFGQNIQVDTVKPVYVMSQRVSHKFTALDLLDRPDPTATDTATLSLQCAGGPAPTLFVNGASSPTEVTFAAGVASADLSFGGSAVTGCELRYTRNGGTVRSAPGTFDVQQGTQLQVAAASTNMTNGGWLQVECSITSGANLTTTGDDSSVLQLDLVNNSFTQYWKIETPDGGSQLRKSVTGGVARWIFQIYSAYPVPSTVQNGAFQCSHQSGTVPLMPPATSADFYLNGRINGTALRLNTDFGSGWPTTASANQTFMVHIERYDPVTGAIDGAQKLMLVQMELFNCPGVRLQQANTSSPFVRLIYGRATVHVKFVGPDRYSCVVLIRQADQPDPQKRLKAYWTNSFEISTPTYLGHNGCTFDQCHTCTAKVGRTTPITVTVYTADGNVSSTNSVVVQLQLTGNSTGAVEVDGKYEQRVVNGRATFNVRFLPSTAPVGMLFYAGTWKSEPVYNITYYTDPVFRAVAIKTGDALVFYRSSVKPIYTCPMPVDRSATQLRLMNRIPTWIPSGDFFNVQVEAVTDFGGRAVGYSEPYNISIVNCNHGLDLDTAFTYRALPGGSDTPVVNYVTGASFSNSQAEFAAQIIYSTQTRHGEGMLNCSLRVGSGVLPPLVIEGFEVRRVFRSCRMCAPGTFSGGGNGTNIDTIPNSLHPGGCQKCMIGTFATVSGATSEAQCEVCAVGDGWTPSNYQHTDEGLTTCPSCAAQNTSVGLPGGGPCPAGNTGQYGSPNNLQHLNRGRLGRICWLAQCITSSPCPNGQFRLFCSSYGNQAACEQTGNNGRCNWNSTSGTCSGAWNVCQECPPGTVGRGGTTNANIGVACQSCAPGQYSEEWGHTSRSNTNHQFEEFRCDALFTNYPRWCTGTGTGICPNGTYQPNAAQSSNASCLTCPAGTYAHQMRVYRRNTPGPALPSQYGAGADTPPRNGYCPQYAGLNSAYQYPLQPYNFLSSALSCTQCPPGTYNPKDGMWDPAHCLPCRAGTYCPRGSTKQHVTDPNASLVLDLTGFTPPTVMSFERAEAPMSCADKWVSNYPGYLQDGHFSNYVQRYYNAPTVLRDSYRNWWHDLSFDGLPTSYPKFYYDPLDRNGATDSGSVRCNATGCVVYQNVSLAQEIVEDLVARVWVYIDTQDINFTGTHYSQTNYSAEKLYGDNAGLLESAHSPFAGLNVTLYSHAHTDSYSHNVTWYAKAVNLNISQVKTWVLVEMVLRPPFPVYAAEFKLEAHGFYHTHIHFDDAALRPAGNRVCNCSTGFFFNASNPQRHCMRCPPGFMCAGGMLRRCVNSWSTGGEPGCRVCWPNWMCDADGRGRLIACPVGTYKSNVTETCEKCLDGHACQDGFLLPCNGGRYGDGGTECHLCPPGNYSLDGGARASCESCPPGTTSNHMRTGCFQCPEDHYSPDGSRCYECPTGYYNPFVGASFCRPCDALFLQAWNYTVPRNSQRNLAVLPDRCSCLPDLAWRIDGVHQLSGAGLGEADRSLSSKKTIRYTAGPQVGTHIFRVHLTSNDGAPMQAVIITVTIDNRVPIVNDDLNLELVHPAKPTTHNLTLVLFNDYDPDSDALFFATLTPGAAMYSAENLTISPDRRSATVDLPTGFTGPAEFQYTVMDEFHANPADCLAPSCLLSPTANIKIYSRRSPPVAVDDNYDVLNGLVYSLDVTANDVDPDKDDIYIVSSTRSTYGAAAAHVPTCPATCSPSAPCRGITGCTCTFDVQRNMCWPDNNHPTIITYTAPTSVCGTDSFTYTIRTADGESTATVYPRIRRCYCANHAPPVYLNFIIDGTTDANGFAFQLGFVDAVQKRSRAASGDFNYGIFVAGQNEVLVPFQNTYIKTQDLTWPSGVGTGNYPLRMGEALNESSVQMNWASLPSPRVLANVVVMGHESADDVVNLDALVKGLHNNFNYVVSVNPADGSDYVNAKLMNPIYSHGVKTFEELVTSFAAQDTMDDVCSQ